MRCLDVTRTGPEGGDLRAVVGRAGLGRVDEYTRHDKLCDTGDRKQKEGGTRRRGAYVLLRCNIIDITLKKMICTLLRLTLRFGIHFSFDKILSCKFFFNIIQKLIFPDIIS